MILDGSPTATGTYVESDNADHMPVAAQHMRVQHDGTLYSGLSALSTRQFGTPVAGKFTQVIQDGITVYTEGHPHRLPMT